MSWAFLSNRRPKATFIQKRFQARRALRCGRDLKAARSCFGKDTWPADIDAPQAWLEFDVDSVEAATVALESNGYRMLVKNKKEPWGQIVSRFISPEGLLVGVTFTPSMREQNSQTETETGSGD